MLKIIGVTLTAVAPIYTLKAKFGYMTFFNHTTSEFLVMFDFVRFENDALANRLIMFAKVTVDYSIICSARIYRLRYSRSLIRDEF